MTTRNYNKLLLVGSIGMVLVFFILNVYTPLVADDFALATNIHSITDIFRSQYNMYFNWGGRNVAHFFAQFWLLTGKPLFNIANTVVYCAFILLVQFHISGTFKKINPLLFIALNITFWIFVPDWGQNFLWLTGSSNYLWTTTIILFFLVPFRKKYDTLNFQLKIPFSILFLFLGILAGWSNENSGAAVLFLLAVYFTRKIIKKEKIVFFEILGTVGFLVGFVTQITAPGNYVRMAVATEELYHIPRNPSVLIYIQRLVNITRVFIRNHGLFLLAISILLGFDFVYHRKKQLHFFSYLYVIAVLAGTYSMILAPGFPDRAFLVVTVFLVITLGKLLAQSDIKVPNIVKRNPLLLTMLMLNIIFFTFLETSIKIVGTYLRSLDRIEYIISEKEKGNFDVVVKPIHSQIRHVASWGLEVQPEKDHWTNTSVAAFFDLNSIRVNNEPQEVLKSDMRKRIRQIFFSPWGKSGWWKIR